MNFSKNELPFVKLWAEDDIDYHIVESGNEFCILYLLSSNFWGFILYNTITDMTVITRDLKDRNYHIIFSQDYIDTWDKCDIEQYALAKFMRFNCYAYL